MAGEGRGRGRGGEGRGRGGSERGELVGGEEKGRKEGKEESVTAHYVHPRSVGHQSSPACGWSVFLCVIIIVIINYVTIITIVIQQ